MFNLNINQYNYNIPKLGNKLFIKKVEVMEGVIHNILKNNFDTDKHKLENIYSLKMIILNGEIDKLATFLRSKKRHL